jgi:hypothetical protein
MHAIPIDRQDGAHPQVQALRKALLAEGAA